MHALWLYFKFTYIYNIQIILIIHLQKWVLYGIQITTIKC